MEHFSYFTSSLPDRSVTPDGTFLVLHLELTVKRFSSLTLSSRDRSVTPGRAFPLLHSKFIRQDCHTIRILSSTSTQIHQTGQSHQMEPFPYLTSISPDFLLLNLDFTRQVSQLTEWAFLLFHIKPNRLVCHTRPSLSCALPWANHT